MIRAHTLLLGSAILGALGSFDDRASAAISSTFFDWEVPGSVCQPIDGRTTEWNWGPQFGINRSCSSCTGSPNVVCPINSLLTSSPEAGVGTLSLLEIDVYDRSSTADVSCTLFLINLDGGIVFSQTQHSNSNQAGVQLLFYNIGVSESNFANATVQCSVPAQTGSGFSHVANFIALAGTP
jgi:hypothetical protein